MGLAGGLFKPAAGADRLEWRPFQPAQDPEPACRHAQPGQRRIQVLRILSDQIDPFLAGARACLAVLPGVATFGMICGAAMVAAGLSRTAAIAMTLLTFAGTMILLFSHVSLPRIVQKGLRFVPAAVFTALVVPDIFVRSGAIQLGLSNPKAAAALVAALVAWKTRNTLLTILSGMAALHLLRLAVIG